MKEIATRARADMERLFGGQVFLEVWVRVKRGWADDDALLSAVRLLTAGHARWPRAAQPQRRDDEPAFVLHTYPYRETSLIVEAFTADHGRVAMVARGAKRPRSETARPAAGVPAARCCRGPGSGELKTLLQGRVARRPAAARAARRCCAAST